MGLWESLAQERHQKAVRRQALAVPVAHFPVKIQQEFPVQNRIVRKTVFHHFFKFAAKAQCSHANPSHFVIRQSIGHFLYGAGIIGLVPVVNHHGIKMETQPVPGPGHLAGRRQTRG